MPRKKTTAVKKTVPQTPATTEKGAVSLGTTTSALVDFFFKTVRGAAIDSLIAKSWTESALDTVKLIFQTRDCRGGKGEKKLFADCVLWLKDNYPEVLEKNLAQIPEFGTWKDLLVLMGTSFENQVLNLLADRLKQDLEAMKADKRDKVSLCAKWAPTEHTNKDKNFHGVAKKLARKLFPKNKQASKLYRTTYLTPLRAYLAVTEVNMCAGDWSKIKYEAVASRCMFNGRKAFAKHDEQGFAHFLALVAEGKAKIKGKQLFPHEIVKVFFKPGKDLVLEAQWNVIIQDVKRNGSLKDALVLSDVSGSMSGTPMEVSIALGLLISEVTDEPFKNHVLTFHEKPTFFVVKGASLSDRVQQIRGMPWGGTTNFQAAFDLILQRAIQFKLKPENMPKRLFVISDMQFDAADHSFKTNHQTIKAKFAKAGYEMPQIVYWNVRSNTADFPVEADETGVALVAGYSPSLLKLFLEKSEVEVKKKTPKGKNNNKKETGKEEQKEEKKETKEKEEMNPFNMMKKAIDDPRYSVLTV